MVTVDILGTEYEIKEQYESQNHKLVSANGLCELWSKEIIINLDGFKNDPDHFENIEALKRKVVRHEIIHAFLFESGLENYCRDEQLVDWLAIMYPKIKKAFESEEVEW